jgi:uncharacterized protein YhaN
MKEYQKALEAEKAVFAELKRVERVRASAGIFCAMLLADVVAKRTRASSAQVRHALDEFEGSSAEYARVSEQMDRATRARMEAAQLSFDAVFKGEP